MKEKAITRTEISLWIDNDEGLYNWFKSSRLPRNKFITENKKELTSCIENVINGKKPAHYLAYPRY